VKRLKAPFPWFGGKSRAAHLIWSRLGDVRHFIEPFMGSLAVLLNRPLHHVGRIETGNDLDPHITNLWRSIQHAPELVIQAAEWPVNETDLHARHLWLVNWLNDDRRERFTLDPFYYEPQVAGWWLWGICQWIGGGWCTPKRPAEVDRPNVGMGRGCHIVPPRHAPEIGTTGKLTNKGVHVLPRKRPIISGMQHGVGVGVNAVPLKKPKLQNGSHLGSGVGVHSQFTDWRDLIRRLQDRLRNARICCGSWRRVCTPSVLGLDNGPVGVLLDPPYSKQAQRSTKIYAEDDLGVAHKVRSWALGGRRPPQRKNSPVRLRGGGPRRTRGRWLVSGCVEGVGGRTAGEGRPREPSIVTKSGYGSRRTA